MVLAILIRQVREGESRQGRREGRREGEVPVAATLSGLICNVMFKSMCYVGDTDCDPEPLYNTSCYPHFAKMRNVRHASSTTIKRHYDPDRAQERKYVIYVRLLGLHL